MRVERPDIDEEERERVERLQGMERLKELALGRARGKPWVPEGSGMPPPACPGPGDDDDVLVAEDEEGMIGHPDPR